MNIRKLRLQKGWTQADLARFSGLNVRTIQRAERSETISIETLKSLSAVFEIPFEQLKKETNMTTNDNPEQVTSVSDEEKAALEQVRELKGFYEHLILFACIGGTMLILDLLSDPSHLWSKWPVFGWAIGVLIHGLNVYEFANIFSPQWEKQQVEKRLGRKL